MIKLIKVAAAFIALVLVAIVIFINTVDINNYKQQIVNLVEDATGRQLQIAGDMRFALSLVPTIIVDDLSLSNASWASKDDMVKLNTLEIKIALLPLLSGDIQVEKLILIEPEILLETNKKGQKNWVFSEVKGNADTTKQQSSINSIAFHYVQIKNATIIYNNGHKGKHAKLDIKEIETQADSSKSPISISINAVYNGIPISGKGEIGSRNQFIQNQTYPIDLDLEVSQAKLILKGEVDQPQTGKGLNLDLKFNVNDLADLSSLAKQKLPKFGPISLSGLLTDSNKSYSIKGMKLLASNTELAGNVAIDFSAKKPKITAKLNSDLLDLAELIGEKKTKPSSNTDRLFSAEPLDLTSLQLANANVDVTAKKIKTSSMLLQNTHITATLNNGNLSLNPLNSLVAGGKLSGKIGINNSGKIPALSVQVKLVGLKPNSLDKLHGKVSGAQSDILLDAEGKGKSISQIMGSLNGRFTVKVGKGVLSDNITTALGTGIITKMVEILNPESKKREDTQLECAVVNFAMKDGLAITDRGIALSTNQLNIIGSGGVNLKTEQINIGIKPEAKKGLGLNASKLASLVRVTGSLSDPQPTANLTLKNGLSVTTAVATGGLSLLAESLVNRATADLDPCATALGQQSTKLPEKSVSTKAVDAVKGVGGTVTDTFKGLFN